MNSVIEIHDSDVETVSSADGKAVLCFSSVYIHKSHGTPGVDPGTGWVQQARLTIAGGIIKSTLPLFPSELLGGYLRLGDSVLDNEIPIPLNFQGDTELHLESWNDKFILVSGSGAELELIGEPTYVEDFPH